MKTLEDRVMNMVPVSNGEWAAEYDFKEDGKVWLPVIAWATVAGFYDESEPTRETRLDAIVIGPEEVLMTAREAAAYMGRKSFPSIIRAEIARDRESAQTWELKKVEGQRGE